ncbi:hypothetical protein Tco_0452396 [Tanacetum coccineum]
MPRYYGPFYAIIALTGTTFDVYPVLRALLFNGSVGELKKLTTSVAHVLPVSDDGGSTAKIVHVLGLVQRWGHTVKHACIVLIQKATSEALAVRTVLSFRLPLDARRAKLEWYSIIVATSSMESVSKALLWNTIRACFAYFSNQDGTIIRGQNEISHPTSGSLQLIDKILVKEAIYCTRIVEKCGLHYIWYGITFLLPSAPIWSVIISTLFFVPKMVQIFCRSSNSLGWPKDSF